MGKLVEQGPVLFIRFNAQAIEVYRNSKGDVVEGDPVSIDFTCLIIYNPNLNFFHIYTLLQQLTFENIVASEDLLMMSNFPLATMFSQLYSMLIFFLIDVDHTYNQIF